MKLYSALYGVLAMIAAQANANEQKPLRVATFNVSMEALNYLPYEKGIPPKVNGDELLTALQSDHQQIKNIAEIIQRINPDIILLNEFDNLADDGQSINLFINRYLAKSQQHQPALHYPFVYQGAVNTGVKLTTDLSGKQPANLPQDAHGFGYFPGHFGMVLLSKYPIDEQNIRTFQHFKWAEMPQAKQPIMPDSDQPYYLPQIWQQLRLSSKSHWDIPIKVNQQTIHILASHPTPPVFDGPEDRNGKRNSDEIRFITDYITTSQSDYIVDDNGRKGGIDVGQPFVIVGDLNASTVDGDADKFGISTLLNHANINDPHPKSVAAKEHTPGNPNAGEHTAYWRMRADYVLPSVNGWQVVDAGVFWPTTDSTEFRLIADRKSSSDHRLVWVDLLLDNNK